MKTTYLVVHSIQEKIYKILTKKNHSYFKGRYTFSKRFFLEMVDVE